MKVLILIITTFFSLEEIPFQMYEVYWKPTVNAKHLPTKATPYIKLFKKLSLFCEPLILEYDTLLNIPQNQAAYCKKTNQVVSVLSIQNLSTDFDATIFISPIGAANESKIYNIKKNTATPIRILHNWNGAVLKVANISARKATLKVSLF